MCIVGLTSKKLSNLEDRKIYNYLIANYISKYKKNPLFLFRFQRKRTYALLNQNTIIGYSYHYFERTTKSYI